MELKAVMIFLDLIFQISLMIYLVVDLDFLALEVDLDQQDLIPDKKEMILYYI